MLTITNDEVLFTCKLGVDRPSKLSLCKQSYSDGTCFYALQDQNGSCKVGYGSRNLKDLVDQMNHELNVEEENKSHDLIKEYPSMKIIYDETKMWRESIIFNLQALIEHEFNTES